MKYLILKDSEASLEKKADNIKISWIKFLYDINANQINLDQIQFFFEQNKEKIENNIDILHLREINFLFSLISFHARSYDHTNHTNDNIYLAKFFLFEFFCNYLLNKSKKHDILRKNFVPIMQQAFLNKSNNSNEENYRNIVINVMARYFHGSIISPLLMTDKSAGLIMKMSELIQKQVIYYLISPSYIIPSLDYENEERSILLGEIEQLLKNKKFHKDMNEYFLSINTGATHDPTILVLRDMIGDNRDYLQHYIAKDGLPKYQKMTKSSLLPEEESFFKKTIEESKKLMEEIVNIAENRALDILKSQLQKKQKILLLADVEETKEISGPNSTPKIVNDQLNHIGNSK